MRHGHDVCAGATLAGKGALLLQLDPPRAQSVLEEALAIQERLGEHVDVASTLVHLAACGNIRHYGRALSIYMRLSRTHPQAAIILKRLATLVEAGHPRQAAAITECAAVAAVKAEHQPCGQCSRMAVHRGHFCGRCKMEWYCDKACQRLAWPSHRPHCRAKPLKPAKPAKPAEQ